MELKRVVVTGLGAITPIGNTVPEFWENLVNGVSGAGPITHFDASLFKTQFACEVKNFDANQYIDRKEARKMDLYTQYAIGVAKQAVEDSGLDVENEDLNKIGVIFGAGIGGIRTFEEEAGNYALHKENGPKFNPFFIPKMISDIAAGQISIMYGFHGPNYATCSACATSTNAIADAFNLIRLGKANVIVSGGSEAAITVGGVGGFNAMHALSTRNESPTTASRPFSASRDGFVMGEGGGCLVLEELEHAKARGAKIYAEVAGVGMSADAHHLTASHLKFFFDNYRDYYYLPAEDMAVHKSVASYVDKNYREPAKKETCYLRKKGYFISQIDDGILSGYKRDYEDKESFIELTDSFLQDLDLLHAYARHIIRLALS